MGSELCGKEGWRGRRRTLSRILALPPLASILFAKLNAELRFLLEYANFIALANANCRCATSSLGIVK